MQMSQPACKPGSVWRPAKPTSATAIHLGRPLLSASCNQPGQQCGHTPGRYRLPGTILAAPIWSCSRWGLPCRRRCRKRGALLPHPFTLTPGLNEVRGGLLSVALSLGSPPPGVTRHRASMEPGLSSTGLKGHKARTRTGSDRPADWLRSTIRWLFLSASSPTYGEP